MGLVNRRQFRRLRSRGAGQDQSPQYYQHQIVQNAKALALAVEKEGFRIVSGGTDNHLFLVDVFSQGLTGKEAERALGEASITVNKNTIPFDTHPPLVTSGIRVGTPAVTTSGMKEAEMNQVGEWIGRVLKHVADGAVLSQVRQEVLSLTARFQFYGERLAQPASGVH